ncbi:hypothetical protein SU69_07375 [Thermosipho melanesiensis]|uniref:Uncharacterized protein n=2 Tax=Thermosipho melanesiensis TaxID=46541 RepID=A6LMZ9_THEM4|nr:hypothetical protein [Thermosipho melanesiensis]ABR31300.1 hypothetical protein Tmel_1453 [Thermosipho melanesiensis BI429]APT74375.1 hypothetical protein BW47_07705 [Thermosipho melanesiensis]OOC36322.1 hypothetical protein SU68_07445 [Thermosipho melanesiensis]OOC37140.1 hypothetical protein SU69_07375 [Thermosipho melanesiensis]OOC37892.1 hypothetical protein SU70_07385 [Thermosipho melanesiensis]
MFSTVRNFITQLETIFDNVTIADDKALQKANNATVFIDKITPEYLTSSRKRNTCDMAILFSVEGTPDPAYDTADTKLGQIETILDTSFNYYEISEIQYSYVQNLKRLFVFVQVSFKWDE